MNPVKKQDRVFDTFDHYKRFGFVMFNENKRTYENIAPHLKGSVLEAGCGMGLGSYIIDADVATDLESSNIAFARELYTKIEFDTWDISAGPYHKKFDTVVCIEAIEHAADFETALHSLINSSDKHVWFSTPNNYEPTPSNPYHVREYTVKEVVEMLKDFNVEIYHWDTFEKLDENTNVNPLIYHIVL